MLVHASTIYSSIMTIREEVYNVTFAEMLLERGGDVQAETRHGQNIPDIAGQWHGVNLVIECKYESPGSREELITQISKRFDAGYGPLGVAIGYPAKWKTSITSPRSVISNEPFYISLRLRDGRKTPWVEVHGFDEFLPLLNAGRALLVTDDDLTAAVEDLNAIVDGIAKALERQPGFTSDIVHLVTVANPIAGDDPTPDEESAARRVAALTIGTALLLQHHLAPIDSKVPAVPTKPRPLHSMRRTLIESWDKVLEHDYRSVFSVSREVLALVGDEETLDWTLQYSVGATQRIVRRRILGRHDLVGRVYHTLLSSQKYLATYFTSVSAATLLTALATDPDIWQEIDWSQEEIEFTIADPSCGTGTLLAAALTSVQHNHILARAKLHQDIHIETFSKFLIERGIFGYDILAYAVQVAAATLLLSAPSTVLDSTNLFQMPFGGKAGSLGSLDFLQGEHAATGTLFDAIGTEHGLDEVTEDSMLLLPTIDLVIMNPPFTRSQNSSRLLGSLPPMELERARKRLSKLGRSDAVKVGTKAGLGAMFLPLAALMVRGKGRIAFVLPKALLTGKDWAPARKLLSTQFHLETVIASHEPGQWNFSDSTSLSEVLIIARKLEPAETLSDKETLWVNLTENPDNAVEALGVAQAIKRSGRLTSGSAITTGGGLFDTVGFSWTRPAPTSDDSWTHAIFNSEELDRVATQLLAFSPLNLPTLKHPTNLNLVPLESLAILGKDVRDVRDAFELIDTVTGYPALWGNKSIETNTLETKSNKYLAQRSVAAPSRPLLDANMVWETSGRLMIAARPRLNTNQVSAVLLPERALASGWWPTRVISDSEVEYKFLALWFNSTLGLIAYMAIGDETEGPFFNIKKNKVLRIPVPNPATLSNEQRTKVEEFWGSLSEKKLVLLGFVWVNSEHQAKVVVGSSMVRPPQQR